MFTTSQTNEKEKEQIWQEEALLPPQINKIEKFGKGKRNNILS